jgi:FtsH-binding integral membrane protein
MSILSSRNTTDVVFDQGLRSFFTDVFMRMTLALVISAVFAGIGSTVPALYSGGVLTWLIILSPLAFVLAMSFGAEKFSNNTLILMFAGFSVAQGLSLGSIFLVYTGASIMTAFFLAAAVFGTFAIMGYTTKRDLTSLGSFLFVGLIGIIIASVVNIWLALPALASVINILAVLIFVGLTAYDVQKLKETYLSGVDDGKVRTLGALSLYLDFINIFIALLQLLGGKKE